MERSELQRLRVEARRGYERGRLRIALTHALLAAAPMILTLTVWPGATTPIVLAVLLYVAMAALLWLGRDAGRGAVAGLVAGSLPLVSLVVATRFGHLCGGGFCVSLCVPICLAGGVLAGSYVAWRGLRSPGSLPFWAAAGIVGSLTAAIGCVPMGLGATLGLVAGFGLAAVPGAALAKFTR
jgi:hypothetical protein